MTPRHPGLPYWYCHGMKCRRTPCEGHEPTRDQILVAQVLAWVDVEEWSDLTWADHRDRLGEAWRVLQRMRCGDLPDGGEISFQSQRAWFGGDRAQT